MTKRILTILSFLGVAFFKHLVNWIFDLVPESLRKEWFRSTLVLIKRIYGFEAPVVFVVGVTLAIVATFYLAKFLLGSKKPRRVEKIYRIGNVDCKLIIWDLADFNSNHSRSRVQVCCAEHKNELELKGVASGRCYQCTYPGCAMSFSKADYESLQAQARSKFLLEDPSGKNN